MAIDWSDPATFHLGINMAGAVSAGAYTAGVLDFLTQALEEWYRAKAANAALPSHNLSIDVFSGASAGGMCAAISAVMLQGNFEHIADPADTKNVNTTNKFYESWVNKIDIEHLLDTSDIQDGRPVVSLLDSDIIDEIAEYAIAPVDASAAIQRPYVSKSLTLFLTVTNVRGVPFSLSGTATGSTDEQIGYYADRIQFETVAAGANPQSKFAFALPIGAPGAGWDLLRDSARATGAFPLFLAPRQLRRIAGEYCYSPWRSIADPPVEVRPKWSLENDSDSFQTLNVDGGLTDNDPFELAHDFLAMNNPDKVRDEATGDWANPRPADKANCAVLTVAPFPAGASYSPDYDFSKVSSIFGMAPNLFNVLISQSRFFGESLGAVTGSKSFSRFVLAPADPDRKGVNALQCGLLGAFGGFFERGFRAHDYQLGRRNCQKFLRDHFRLAIDNPIVKAGLARFDAATQEAIKAKYDPDRKGFLPIVPLCGGAVDEVKAPQRATITSTRLGHILNWCVVRLHAVARPLIESTLGKDFESWTARQAADALISTWGRAKLNDMLKKQLGDLIVDQ